MTELKQVYKCNICGNIVEMVHEGLGELVCCGQPMQLINEITTKNEENEKHIPVIEKTATGFKIKIGSVPHPMEQKHFIEWIELITAENNVLRKHLKPDEKPEAEFCVTTRRAYARAYCNVHGLWVK